MCVHVCYDNVFALQLHVEGVQVHSDVRQKIILTKKAGDLLLQVAHMGQHGSSTQLANLTKVKQISVLHVDIVIQCLKLAVIQARERMELTTFTTTDMPSTRLADLAHRQSLVVNE